MYLLPTMEEINALRRQLNPRDRYIAAVRAAVNEACRFDEDSMAFFFLQSEDTELIEEEGAMHYHIDPPAYLDYIPGRDAVRFNGSTIEIPKCTVDLGEHVEWDDI